MNDLKFAVRQLSKNPSSTAVAVLTVALGIGANTTIFSIVNSVLLQPLPYRDSNRLVTLWQSAKAKELSQFSLTHAHFAAYRDQNHCFERFGAYAQDNFNLTGLGEPERIRGAKVTLDFFDALGQQPFLGRTFFPAEDVPGKNLVCVLSYGLWQRRFGSDPTILGRTLTLDNISTEVVGIMAPAFDFPKTTDIWIPLGLDPQKTSPYYLRAIGKLKPEITAAQAQAETTAIGQNFARARPDVHPNGPNFVTKVTLLKFEIVETITRPLLVLLASVGVVLLIVCANLACLLLARATARMKEVALRLSLGASRSRIFRHALTESFLLAGVGTLIGIGLALLGVRLLTATLLEHMARVEEIKISGLVLGYSSLLAMLTGALFGLAPAISASRTDLQAHLRDASGSTAIASRHRSTRVFVSFQFALALILLVGAGLLLKSFHQLLAVDLGFRPEHVLTLRLSLPAQRYPTHDASRIFYKRLLENIRGLPAVLAAGVNSVLPFGGEDWDDIYNAEAGNVRTDQDQTSLFTGRGSALAKICIISPGYAEAIGMRLLQGRCFQESDGATGEPVVMVDRALAHRHWPNQSAVGKRLRFGRPEDKQPWMRIVGVVDTVKHERLDEDPVAHLYIPYAQRGSRSFFLAVRTSADPEVMTSAVRQAVHKLDPQLPIYEIRTMLQAVGDSLSTRRLTNTLLAAFAVTALLLAAVGTFGLMSVTVNERMRELGIRLALGAAASDVLGLVIKEGLLLAGIGIIAGLAGALAFTRLLSSLLFGVGSTDPAVFTMVSLLLLVTAVLACWLPAQRAVKIDPIEALRCE